MTSVPDPDDHYDAILFDMDGVLLRGAATEATVYQEAADAVIDRFDLDVTDTRRRSLGKYQFDDGMARCCRAVGIEPDEFWEAREEAASAIANRRLSAGKREHYPDTDVLSDVDVHLGIVSNNRIDTVRHVAETMFDWQFSVAIGRDPTVEGYRRRKPDPFYLERALAELGEPSAVYVGDRESDVVVATRVGIDSAFVRREHNSRMTLDTQPTYDIDNLDSLAALVADDGE